VQAAFDGLRLRGERREIDREQVLRQAGLDRSPEEEVAPEPEQGGLRAGRPRTFSSSANGPDAGTTGEAGGRCA